MSLVLADGFDNQFQKSPYGVSNTANVYWATGEGLKGGGALRINNSNTLSANWAEFRMAFVNYSVNTGFRISFWMKSSVPNVVLNSSGNTDNGGTIPGSIFIAFTTNESGAHWVMMNNAGYLDIRSAHNRVYSAGLYPFSAIPTPGVNLVDGNWHHVYIAIRYSEGADGWVQLRIDDHPWVIYNGSTINGTVYGTSNRGPLNFYINNLKTATAGYMLIDDMMIWSDVVNNDGFANNYIPPQIITTLRPSADTIDVNSAPSTGSDRWSILNKQDANAQNGYVSLAPGKRDMYEFTDLPESYNVRAIAVNMNYASANVGTRANVRLVLASNNFYQNGNTYTTQSLSYLHPYSGGWSLRDGHLVLGNFGNSNVAWAQTSVNAIQIGIENTGVP